MNFEERFRADLLKRIQEAEEAIGNHQFKILRQLIDEQGAVKTAKGLVDLTRPQKTNYGMEVLAKEKWLKSSVEQCMLDHAGDDDCEFTKAELASAKTRIALARRAALKAQ